LAVWQFCVFLTLYYCCARFVNLRNLQNALRNVEIAHAQFAPDPVLTLAKSRSAFCELHRLTNWAQHFKCYDIARQKLALLWSALAFNYALFDSRI